MGELEELADRIKQQSLEIAKEIILQLHDGFSLTGSSRYIDVMTELGLAENDPAEEDCGLAMYRLTPEGQKLKLATQDGYGKR